MSKSLVIQKEHSIPVGLLPLTNEWRSHLFACPNRNSPRLHSEIAAKIVEEIDASLRVSGINQAAETVFVLFGMFPEHKVPEPEIYQKGVKAQFQMYPPDIQKASIAVMVKKFKRLPTVNHVKETLQAIKTERLRFRSNALAHCALNDEIQAELKREQQRVQEQQEFRQKHGGKTLIEVLADTGEYPFLANIVEKRKMRHGKKN